VLFEMLRVKEVYVVEEGHLRGVINWNRILNNLKAKKNNSKMNGMK